GAVRGALGVDGVVGVGPGRVGAGDEQVAWHGAHRLLYRRVGDGPVAGEGVDECSTQPVGLVGFGAVVHHGVLGESGQVVLVGAGEAEPVEVEEEVVGQYGAQSAFQVSGAGQVGQFASGVGQGVGPSGVEQAAADERTVIGGQEPPHAVPGLRRGRRGGGPAGAHGGRARPYVALFVVVQARTAQQGGGGDHGLLTASEQFSRTARPAGVQVSEDVRGVGAEQGVGGRHRLCSAEGGLLGLVDGVVPGGDRSAVAQVLQGGVEVVPGERGGVAQ